MSQSVISKGAIGLSKVSTKPHDDRVEDNTNGFQLDGLGSELEKKLVRKLDRSILLIVAILCMSNSTTSITQFETADKAANKTRLSLDLFSYFDRSNIGYSITE